MWKKLSNKGFTLIELIAIVALLALFFIVTFPSLTTILKSDEENQYKVMVKNLCLAGENFVYSNVNTTLADGTIVSISPGNTFEIKIQYLMDDGLIDQDMIDVKTKQSIKNKKIVFKVENDKTLNCSYY